MIPTIRPLDNQPLATPYDHYLAKHTSNNGKTVFPKNEKRSFKGSSKQKKPTPTWKKPPQCSHCLISVSSSDLLDGKSGSNYSGKRVSTSSKI